jgi:alpha-N-arabinofuranosidase
MNKQTTILSIIIIIAVNFIASCGSGSSTNTEKNNEQVNGSTPAPTPVPIPAPNPEPAPLPTVLPTGAKVSISPAIIKHTVSPMIQGQGLIYSHEADHIYADGSIAQLYKDVGAGFLRYPGGTVTTMYHWNDLNGQGWTDSWNPNYNRANDALAENYMDLDEYITLCRASNCEPMLGINMSSGRNFDRDEDGLNEAIALLKYCKEKNFEVNYLYLDNENHHKKWPVKEYADLINYYAPALKEHAPNAKLIANWTDKFRTNRSGFKTLLDTAGDNFDYIDVHYYWKWGLATWDMWKATTPMNNVSDEWYKDGGTYTEEITYYNEMMAELGKPNIKLAVMEWNIGPGPHSADPEHTPFKTALMQAEMQMQMMLGGLEIGSLWSTQWPDTGDSSFRFLVDSSDNYQPTPTAKVFELYKHALKGELVQSAATQSQLLTTAVIQGNKAFVYLLNKSDEPEEIYFDISGYDIVAVYQAVSFQDPGVIENIAINKINDYYQTSPLANTLTMFELLIDKQ